MISILIEISLKNNLLEKNKKYQQILILKVILKIHNMKNQISRTKIKF